mmetsp:Transcript_101412/g.295475  ORF Transcript_101412/g.295475 Transcript_101412/m.295475 type:complete len:204 (-) Transcript_101412:294-905(-)
MLEATTPRSRSRSASDRTRSTSASELITSKMPSQASTMKSPRCRLPKNSSGTQETFCSDGCLDASCLNMKSPKPRDTAKFPSRRGTSPPKPTPLTNPPACSIRALSSGHPGLWSLDARSSFAVALPALWLTSRPLESPALAMKHWKPSPPSAGQRPAATHVLPELSFLVPLSRASLSVVSRSMKAFCTAFVNMSEEPEAVLDA